MGGVFNAVHGIEFVRIWGFEISNRKIAEKLISAIFFATNVAEYLQLALLLVTTDVAWFFCNLRCGVDLFYVRYIMLGINSV